MPPTEQQVLECLQDELGGFERLPKLERLIDAERRYKDQKKELEQKRQNIKFKWQENGYALNTDDQVIGLNFGDARLNDLSLLCSFQQLSRLSLQGGDLDDITWISSLINLTTLNLRRNKITDLSPLSTLNDLTTLDLRENQIVDISPLSTLNKLTTVNLRENQIVDISPLSTLNKLTTVNLRENQIVDISPLVQLMQLETLDLRNNKIVSLPQEFVKCAMKIKWDDRFYYRRHTGVNFYDNPFQRPPANIVKQGRAVMLNWFRLNEIQSKLIADLIDEFSYLEIFFEGIEQQIDKYHCFLLTAEYLFSHLKEYSQFDKRGGFLLKEYSQFDKRGGFLDSSVVIMEYVKIVDTILQEYVGQYLPSNIQNLRAPYTVGVWDRLCNEFEYQEKVNEHYRYSQELRNFLINDLTQFITPEFIKLRNDAVHHKLCTWSDAREMRKKLLRQRVNGKTLMERLLEILYYNYTVGSLVK